MVELLRTSCVNVVDKRVVRTRDTTDVTDRVVTRVTVGVVYALMVFVVAVFASVVWLVDVWVVRLVELVGKGSLRP